MPKSHSKNRGFTLIEIILVIAVMAILSVAALQQGVKLQKQLKFLSEFKQVVAELKKPRVYAITSLTVPDLANYDNDNDTTETYVPPAYGAYFDDSTNEIYVFADLAGDYVTPFVFDRDITSPGTFDYVIDDPAYAISNPRDLDPPQFQLLDDTCTNPLESFSLFYEPIYADYTATDNDLGIDMTDEYINICFADTLNDISKFIIISKKTGIIETTNDIDEFFGS